MAIIYLPSMLVANFFFFLKPADDRYPAENGCLSNGPTVTEQGMGLSRQGSEILSIAGTNGNSIRHDGQSGVELGGSARNVHSMSPRDRQIAQPFGPPR